MAGLEEYPFTFFSEDLLGQFRYAMGRADTGSARAFLENGELIQAQKSELLSLEGTLRAVCATESMKNAIRFMIQASEDPAKTTDCALYRQRNGEIKGFVFIRHVESCVSFGPTKGQQTISVEYICTNVSGISKFLLGLVLFCSNLREIDNVILQADRGFLNFSAYCVYRKMGFQVASDLVPACFNANPYNVAMIAYPRLDGIDNIVHMTTTSSDLGEAVCKRGADQLIEAVKRQQEYGLDMLYSKKGTSKSMKAWLKVLSGETQGRNPEEGEQALYKELFDDYLQLCLPYTPSQHRPPIFNILHRNEIVLCPPRVIGDIGRPKMGGRTNRAKRRRTKTKKARAKSTRRRTRRRMRGRKE